MAYYFDHLPNLKPLNIQFRQEIKIFLYIVKDIVSGGKGTNKDKSAALEYVNFRLDEFG